MTCGETCALGVGGTSGTSCPGAGEKAPGGRRYAVEGQKGTTTKKQKLKQAEAGTKTAEKEN